MDTSSRESRDTSFRYPEQLRDEPDSQSDFAAVDHKQAQYMNQSVFSMIAAASSRTQFTAHIDAESSDSEEDDHEESHVGARSITSQPGSRGSIDSRVADGLDQVNVSEQVEDGDRGGLSHMMQSTILNDPLIPQGPFNEMASATSTLASPSTAAPFMSQILAARNETDTMASEDTVQPLEHNLSIRLKEIFGFTKPEKIIAEYPCWLMQNVLLQGYMYITQKHVAFYAYLPKKADTISRSGYLAKRGRQNPKFRRYWFSLKGEVFSYYSDQTDKYFPSGSINLRYGITAALDSVKDRTKETKDFSITTDQRIYYFKADTPSSAKEWVRTLQKTIFRSHNDGDSIKICLPIQNIIDVEESPLIEFAKTYKIRVVESDETYAIDEYFFTFFDGGESAFQTLSLAVENTLAQRIPSELLTPSSPCTPTRSARDMSRASSANRLHKLAIDPIPVGAPHLLTDQVRATLSPSSPTSPGNLRSTMTRSHMLDYKQQGADLKRRSLDISRRDLSLSSLERYRRPSSMSRGRNIQQSVTSVPNLNDANAILISSTNDDLPRRSQSTKDARKPESEPKSRSSLSYSRQNSPRRAVTIAAEEVQRGRKQSACQALEISRSDVERSSSSRSLGSRILRNTSQPDSASSPDIAVSTAQPTTSAGINPLGKAVGFANLLRKRSKRFSTAIASGSSGYVDKVSDMWVGDPKHFDNNNMQGIDTDAETVDFHEADTSSERFRDHFSFPIVERLVATYYCYLHRVLPLYGKIYISSNFFCFRSLLPGTKTKLVLPMVDIESAVKEKGFRFGYSGLVLVIRGHEELFFEFTHHDNRDDCAVTVLKTIANKDFTISKDLDDEEAAKLAKEEHTALLRARTHGALGDGMASNNMMVEQPISFDDPRASILNFKPTESLKITCLTIGSRGDVQPYIALCKGLMRDGHKATIATHKEFESWIRGYGIDFAPVGGDPAQLMALCVDYGMFTYAFLKEASSKFRGWLDELLSSAWMACQGAELLIESPSTMAGIHIAESLQIPYFRAFTMPWTRTRAYPHAFVVPEHKMGGAYNYLTYVMFDNVFWKATAGQVNRWRKKELGLPSTNLDRLQPNKVPFLYNFSPSVVIPPLDYSDWVRVTGYWFLDEGSEWTPPAELKAFIAKAKADKTKIVYIGFGSIVVSDPAALTKTVVESVLKAGVRAILSKGWSDRLDAHSTSSATPEITLPQEIFQIKSAPHDWLFRQIDAAVHHGGAGTTGASLRAGIPTVIKPFFGDQFFFGARVEDIGVGVCMKRLNVARFSRALWEVTHSERIITKANLIGEKIRNENGVDTAIQAIYRDLEYAKSLIKRKTELPPADGIGGFDEETWTFIGDESDPELQRKIRAWDPRWREGRDGGDGMNDKSDSET